MKVTLTALLTKNNPLVFLLTYSHSGRREVQSCVKYSNTRSQKSLNILLYQLWSSVLTRLNFKQHNLRFIVVKSGNFCQRVCHEALFDWKFFKIGSVRVRDLIKNVPILQAGWPALYPLTLPVLRVVLLQSEAFAKRLQVGSVHVTSESDEQ